jgi:hypothetical protein
MGSPTEVQAAASQPPTATTASSEKVSSDFESVRNLKQREGEAYASGGDTRYYEPIDSYEGKHRWDPKADWTDKEEKHVVRKLDMRICSWACLMFFALQLDRGNINQALSDNMVRLVKNRKGGDGQVANNLDS